MLLLFLGRQFNSSLTFWVYYLTVTVLTTPVLPDRICTVDFTYQIASIVRAVENVQKIEDKYIKDSMHLATTDLRNLICFKKETQNDYDNNLQHPQTKDETEASQEEEKGFQDKICCHLFSRTMLINLLDFGKHDKVWFFFKIRKMCLENLCGVQYMYYGIFENIFYTVFYYGELTIQLTINLWNEMFDKK